MPTSLDKTLIFYFRLVIGWTFLYAGVSQLADPGWSVVGFLGGTKTFHDVLAPFAAPAVAPTMTFLVEWGHLLIGLSLVSGLLVRVSASFGVMLMLMYYMAHMDFPYIENKLNFLVDYHLVYAGVLVYLIARHAGHVWGLDGWAERLPLIRQHPALRPLVA
jgi:thiosulfate dehydrogenase [quinone] large subunit